MYLVTSSQAHSFEILNIRIIRSIIILSGSMYLFVAEAQRIFNSEDLKVFSLIPPTCWWIRKFRYN